MKYTIPLLTLLATICTANVQCQTISEHLISPYILSNDVNLSSSGGQTAISTLLSSNYIITQGFHQGDPEASTSVGITSTDISAQILAYPNPAKDQVRVRLPESFVNAGYDLRMYNLQGLMFPAVVSDIAGEVVINLQNIPRGICLIQFTSSDQKSHGILRINKF